MSQPRLQIAYITGRSRPRDWSLSPAQADFIARVTDGEESAVALNFPWIPLPEGRYAATPLLRASVNNAREYLGSRRAGFVQHYQSSAVQLIERADHTLLLSGSCGLELFNNLQLPPALMQRVSVFAYGPVARKRPDCRHLLVQGHRDWISRLWFSQSDVQIDCGHMDYLVQPEMVTLCRGFIHSLDEREA